jgi:ABC-type phosphate/phosphonate transport system substrate-binding protein
MVNGRERFRTLVVVLCVALIAACRPRDVQQQQRFLAATPTPLSTPLPVVPTPIPPGAEGNPLWMVVRPIDSSGAADTESAAKALTDMIKQKTSLSVQVVTVNRYAEALAALCGSGKGQVAIAWLDGITYAAANAQNCGLPVLQVKRDTKREVETGASGQIIVSRTLGTGDIGALNGRTFCRLNVSDFYSWLLPSLVLKTKGIDVLRDVQSVSDYRDVPALVKAVASGDCAGAGVSEDVFTQYADQLADVKDQVRVVDTTPSFPYDILLFPLEVQLGVRLTLTDTLMDIASNPDTAGSLRTLLGQDSLSRVQPDDFNDLQKFMSDTGLDFTQLGN